MPKTSKTLDFGEKIGGARKDAWASRGLISSDIDDMTDYEKGQYVNKNYIWKKPDYEKMLEDGVPREVIYFIKLVRDALPAKFSGNYLLDITKDEQYKLYIDFIQQIKGAVENVRTVNEVNSLSSYLENEGMLERFGRRYDVPTKYHTLVTNKLVNVMCLYGPNIHRYEREIKRKEFLLSDFDKALKDYTVIRLMDDTWIAGHRYHEFIARNFPTENYITVMGAIALPDNKEGMGGSLMRKEDLQRVIDEVKVGEFFVVKGMKFLFKGNDPEKLFEQCFEHYKEVNADASKTAGKSGNKRKIAYVPPQLKHVKRDGPEWRPHGKNVTGETMLEDFGFRGGEFGNWLNENDRIQSLNFCYDALMDLSYALGMQPKDISFDGILAIAFGSRGKGGRSAGIAHYEPARQVINLTKMKGAGSLAHEWIHAMDHAAASYFAGTTVSLATQASYSTRKHIPAEFNEIMKVIKGCPNFIAAAEKMDKEYSKTGQGYWSSDCELLARAGACWIRDRLTSVGIRNDYLVGHSEGEMISPHGKEREVIDSAFDAWLSKAKEVGFFNQQYLLRGKVQEVGVALDLSPDDWVREPAYEYKQLSIFDVPGIETINRDDTRDESFELPSFFL